MADRGPLTINELKNEASKKLPKPYREYFNEGAMDLLTLRDNEAAYDRYKIRPRVLMNISNLDMTTTIFGAKIAFPFGFSPAALHKIAHPDGEIATSRAASNKNIPMALSAYSTCSMEAVIAEGHGNPYVMQVTLLKDRATTLRMIQRAEKAGYKAILLTVDGSVLARRLSEVRNKFSLPKGMSYPNFDIEMTSEATKFDETAEWSAVIPLLRSHTKLPIWIKGIYTSEDVLLAIRYNLDGVIFSNHGGRQIDTVPATLDVLRECAPLAKGKTAIAIDGGIRRGSDIFKALALGADFCFAGRVPIWGLAYDGQRGVELAIQLLIDEFKIVMALAGCRSIKEISRSHLSLLESNGMLSKL